MQLPLRPISDCYGYDRGTPVDRIYIEAFLDRHCDDIRGHGAEVKTDGYLRRFGPRPAAWNRRPPGATTGHPAWASPRKDPS